MSLCRSPSLLRFLYLCLLTPPLWAGTAQAQEGVAVKITINDAMVKDKPLKGVFVSARPAGQKEPVYQTTSNTLGQVRFVMAPGDYRLNYLKPGYVPITDSVLEVKEPMEFTTSMSMMLESAGQAGRRRVQVVLNWGEEAEGVVEDMDLYMACPWGDPPKMVYFADRRQEQGKASAELDVDDMDYGGPETITLLDPPAGDYPVWINSYSGPPQQLGTSQVHIRLLDGERIMLETVPPRAWVGRDWRPFKSLRVDEHGRVSLVDFSKAERKNAAHARPPEGLQSATGYFGCGSIYGCIGGMSVLFLIFFSFAVIRRIKKTRLS